MLLRTSWLLGVASGLLCVLGGPARAGAILPGGTFDVAITNDPSGGDFSQSGIPLSTNPTPIDNGLLTVSELIRPVNASTDWIQFTFSATNGRPLVGDPASNWQYEISNIQTTGPSIKLQQFNTFVDASGTATPFPFEGNSTTTNPIPGQPSPVSLHTFSPPSSFIGLDFIIDPFNSPPTNFGNGGSTPTEFIAGAQFQLSGVSTVPEPATWVMTGTAALAVLSYRWYRRKRVPQRLGLTRPGPDVSRRLP